MPSTAAQIKNIIFDWSGTLSDDFALSFKSTMATLKAFGGPKLTLKQYREQFTLPVRDFYGRHLKGATVQEIDRFYFEHFTSVMRQAHLYAGVKEALKECTRQKLNLFIFSTVRQDLLEEALVREGIAPFFVGASRRLAQKQRRVKGSVMDKSVEFKSFLKANNLKPDQTLYIGDMEHDIEAARAYGLHAGVFLNGYHASERLLKHAPDFVWNDQKGFASSIKHLHPVKKKGKPFALATVGALIFNQGKVLLIQTHKWGHTFGIPGGKVKYGESMVQALKREISEETGLAISNIRDALTMDSVFSKEFYSKKSHFLLVNFLADASSQNVRLNDEAQSFIWVEPQLALKMNLNEPTRELIKFYLRSRS